MRETIAAEDFAPGDRIILGPDQSWIRPRPRDVDHPGPWVLVDRPIKRYDPILYNPETGRIWLLAGTHVDGPAITADPAAGS